MLPSRGARADARSPPGATHLPGRNSIARGCRFDETVREAVAALSLERFVTMNPPITLEVYHEYSCYRPTGHVTFNLGVELIANAIAKASSNGIQRLLVDTTELWGFPHPITSERHHLAEQWAARARGLRLSVVARPEMIDPLRYGVMVGRKLGLFSNVFSSEVEAVEWLMDPDAE